MPKVPNEPSTASTPDVPDMPWREAVIHVLQQSDDPMHYTDIAAQIVEDGLRVSVGAAPAATVNAKITTSLKYDRADSPFIRVRRGEYFLRARLEEAQGNAAENQAGENEGEYDSVVQAFGMYWKSHLIHWSSSPNLLGRQQIGADAVNFCNQVGVYLLHDRREVVYVGRATDRSLGTRLYEHTRDRHRGRWDSFSWFGLKKVTEEGQLEDANIQPSTETIVSTLEALMIEGLEPRQNRKRGDDFRAIEYLQAEDPEIERQKLRTSLLDMIQKLEKAENPGNEKQQLRAVLLEMQQRLG